MTKLPNPTWLVGCGNMGGAIVEGWRAAEIDLSGAVAIRPSGTPVEGVRTVTSLAQAGPPPKLVVLGFKPQKLDSIAPELQPWLSSKTILVSILAGASAQSLRRRFAKPAAIIRAMPNTPVAIRRGVVALFSEDADEAQRAEIGGLFAPLGFTLWTRTEEQFGTIGSIAGSGPAYVARFVAALAKAGQARGLSPELSATLALETLLGTGWLAASRQADMAQIARQVASPGGTTEAGLKMLDGEQALDRLIDSVIDAAGKRGAEMAGETR